MSWKDGIVREQAAFLGQPADQLRQERGQALYDRLNTLGLSHGQFFRALGTNLDEYCAREFGIDLNRVTVERFFASDPNAKWLFPDIVRDAVVAGLRRRPVYPELVARDEPVNGTAYDIPYVNENEAEEELRAVAEGAAIPESEITHGSRIVRLAKMGRGVVASYEAVRRMSVDMLRVHLQRIGERLGRALDARLAQLLVSGDGVNAETAPAVIDTAAGGAWAYADLVAGFLELMLGNYFTPTHMLAGPETAKAILNLPELKDSALFDFAKSGKLPTPLGVKLVPMADHPEQKLTILDAAFAAQKVTEQDVLVESDKLINQQWERTFITTVTDFAILYDKARVVVNSDWS